jgi:hypothetical protein
MGKAVDVCDFEIEFRAIGDRSVEEACRGWEVVAVMIDEADLQPPELLAFLSGRVGRSSDLDPPWLSTRRSSCRSMRPTSTTGCTPWRSRTSFRTCSIRLWSKHWMGVLWSRALSSLAGVPHAENLHNLPRGYYTIQAALNKHRPDYVARMIDNKPVPMQHGQPVNPQFDFERHVRPLEWDRSRALTLAFDQGLFAAAVVGQQGRMAACGRCARW